MSPADPFDTGRLRLLGEGAESCVYALDDDRVLRVSKTSDLPSTAVRRRQALCELAAPHLPYDVPSIMELGTTDGRSYSIERRIRGRPMAEVLPTLEGARRRLLLGSYLAAAEQVRKVVLDERPYGELLTEEPLTGETWHAYLRASMDAVLLRHGPALRADAEFDEAAAARLLGSLAHLPEDPPKTLVHGDFYPANVMVTDDLEVSGVLDFGAMTLVGDAQVDIAGSLMWLELLPGHRAADTATLRELIGDRFGPAIDPALVFYRVFYSLSYAGSREDDPRLYEWCMRNLRAWSRRS